MTTRFPAADLDLNALRHNLEIVRARAPRSRIMAVTKANAYGHDLSLVAGALGSADAMAVARVTEGAEIRSRGFQRRIVVLEGVNNSREMALASRYRLELVVHHADQLALLQGQPQKNAFCIWLKINTGMNRLGLSGDDAISALKQLRKSPQVQQPVNIMTHLPKADLRADTLTRKQIDRFAEFTADADGDLTIANSAGLLAWPECQLDWVRPGIMLYGISPFAGQNGSELGLKPVMHFHTRIIAKNRIKAGDSVGYGAEWTAPTATSIAIAAAGYGDGYPARVPVDTVVAVNGRQCPVVGRVSMDMLAIDLGPDAGEAVGDPVTLWGPGLPVEELARRTGRLSYELVCGVSQRVPRQTNAIRY
ncbi:MAG: alanine racemase [Gammaproteobacteria bacterium]|nr:alanine racemase [Gammaproteobacteria bacterium]